MEGNMKKILLSLGFIVFNTGFAHNHEHRHEMRSETSHIHGSLHAHIVVEDNEVEIELYGASNNFVDFEHKPQTKEEENALKTVGNVLKQEKFIGLSPKAKCRLDDYDFEFDAEEHHADIEVDFEYKCKNMKALTEITFDFSHFPLMEIIEVEYIDDKGHVAKQTLSSENNKFQLP